MKRLKKILAIALSVTVCMAFSFTIQLSAVSAEDQAVQIGNYQQLSDFIEGINNGTIAAGTDAELTANIIVPAEIGNEFVPLGCDKKHSYQGTFDGNGMKISNIKIDREYPKKYAKSMRVHDFTALISFLGEKGVVTDLDVEADIHDINDVAGIVSQNYGTIEYCTFRGKLVSDIYPDGNVGYGADRDPDFCGESGGIAALNYGTVLYCQTLSNTVIERGGCRAGGIVGAQVDGALLEECRSWASVSTRDTVYETMGIYEGSAGGVVGATGLTDEENGTLEPEIKNCSNSGKVKAGFNAGGVVGLLDGGIVHDTLNDGTVTGKGRATGGIAGLVLAGGVKAVPKIYACMNKGSVSGVDMVGGIVGGDSYEGQVYNCKNTGDVKGLMQVGGIAGKFENGLDSKGYTYIYNLINLGNVTGTSTIGGVAGACPGVISCTINYGTVKQIKDKSGDYDTEFAGGLVGYSGNTGAVRNSVNVGKVLAAEIYNGESYVGGITGAAASIDQISSCYYCVESAGDAKNALGNSFATFTGGVTLKQMRTPKTNMKNLFSAKNSFRPSVSWAPVDPLKIGDSTVVFPPRFIVEHYIQETEEEILASGADLVQKYKTNMSSAYVNTTKSKYIYTGDYIKPKLEVTFLDGLLASSNYSVYKYADNIDVGYGTVIIQGKGNYYGVAEGEFEIVPRTGVIKKLTAGVKKFKVVAKRKVVNTGGNRYRIAYKAKGAKKWHYKTVKSGVATVRTIGGKKLKSGKTYQVKIRAFKTVDGLTHNGAWSEIKSVKVK